MLPLALAYQKKGLAVAGSDSTRSEILSQLDREGVVSVSLGHDGVPVRDHCADCLILTDAIDLRTSPEVAMARELGIPLFRRSQALAHLLRGKKVIAVTGSHGKTTTTGLLVAGMREAGLDPTYFVGAEVRGFESAHFNDSDWAVIEACEAYDSLRDYDPAFVILTNLELDHVDFHGSWESLRNTVVSFVDRVPEEGRLIFCQDDSGACEVAEMTKVGSLGVTVSSFSLECLRLPGDHNRKNASLALALGETLGFGESFAQGVYGFLGARSRLEPIAVLRRGDEVVDCVMDYAHHPTEIEASLQALREQYPGRRIVVAYQPHLYSRTADLIPEFASALSLADVAVLTDIYPAREKPMPGVSSLRIVQLLRCDHHYVPSRFVLPRFLAKLVQHPDVLVVMGAGNIDETPGSFVKEAHRLGWLSADLSEPYVPEIMVVVGGRSAEREVSLNSGEAVYQSLLRLGYKARKVDLSEAALGDGLLTFVSGVNRPDLAVLMVHGPGEEDGSVQGFLDYMGIPYTGSSLQASAIAIDKGLTKKLYQEAGLPVPRGVTLRRGDPLPIYTEPVVVKPNSQGSTVGLSFVSRQEELESAVELAFLYDEEVVVEQWVRGIEISVPVFGDRAMPIIEIVPTTHYDFAAKYVPGATLEICPARLSEATTGKAQELALKAHKTLRARGITRTDMIVVGEELVILETNTLPGMTPTSLVPQSAKSAGMSFDDLVDWIVKDALTQST
jgi:D-alanine--D-alanine ligase